MIEVICGSHNLKTKHQGCVVTIGNFDGLHLGHQKLLRLLIQKSQELALPATAIIFEPQPNEFFSKEVAPRLMRFREKVEAFEKLGLDRVLCLHFDAKMANQTAELFVRNILFEKLSVKYVIVGDDFRFGYKRLGDYSLLKEFGDKYHFKTDSMPTFELLGDRVSSTRVRMLLAEGDMETAQSLLGRPYSMKGIVAQGDKRGRLLDCPTANIHVLRKWVPLSGVFAIEMLGIEDAPIPGIANIGVRPTVSGSMRTLLEVHLLDFEKDIYGKRVEVNFLKKFRDERKFENFEALKAQIHRDIESARHYHSHRPLKI